MLKSRKTVQDLQESIQKQGWIQGGWGGNGGPCPPHPFGTEQVLKAEDYHALNVRTYLLWHSAHLYMNHCFMSCKHKALKSAASKRQFCSSASNTKADSEGRMWQVWSVRNRLRFEVPAFYSWSYRFTVHIWPSIVMLLFCMMTTHASAYSN